MESLLRANYLRIRSLYLRAFVLLQQRMFTISLFCGLVLDYEQEVFRLTCQYREENGLNPLSYNTLCQEASDIRALEIVLRFDHTRPDGTR